MTEPTNSPSDDPRGWYSRGYLRRFDGGGSKSQFITCRLADSLPAGVIDRIRQEIEIRQPDHISRETFVLAEKFLDAGHGKCLLLDPRVAGIVRDAILYLAARGRYKLYAWVIMPNHIHLLLRPSPGIQLEKIIHSLKSFTGLEANRLLGRKGRFWMREAFDRYIRDDDHFARAFRYIENNPVKAGLCESPEMWEFGRAFGRPESERWGMIV